ncbi:YcnI family protein [Gordonia soli]|uniref:YncI copper-binding domain-containing protein n=1 Tax=Gordonia soli NBRC 108243 TaxID=1223545 RepID=M0QIX3_9ACTN|nr:YcnI family protein [Gordonia soli]GAC68379.1 hypothetical protein GS4_15_00280 [Gordonia soli NBRC 108243]
MSSTVITPAVPPSIRPRSTRVRRSLVATVAAGSAAGAVLLGSGAASAHVTANAPTLTQGGYGVVTLVVPNESDTSPTTTLTVTLPNLKSARAEVLPGWKADIVKDPSSKEATSITWTALPGTPGVPVGEFQQFRISGGPFPEEETVGLPAVQTYADGEKASWTEPENSDGSEAEYPTPTLTLAPAAEGGDHHGSSTATATNEDSTAQASSSDSAARWIGGIGLVVGALGVVVAVAALARSSRRAAAASTNAASTDTGSAGTEDKGGSDA